MYSKAVAFILGILSFIPPFSGLLRFYLKRYPSGFLFTVTAGCVFIGNILDIVQIPQLVRDANMKLKQREMSLLQRADVAEGEITRRELEYRSREESIEKYILRSAKKNRGYTTPSEVALESGVPIEEAQKSLDYLVSKGFAEMKVSKTGTIIYHFPDILTGADSHDYEDLP